MLECLRAGGAKMPDITDENKNALLLRYALNGAAPLVIAVLQAGANTDHRDPNQQTPLHVSAAKGSEAACRVLIEHRANVNAQDQYGKTPLDMAHKEEVKAVLRQHGGKHTLLVAAEKGMVQDVAELIKGGADVNQTDSGKHTALHHAAANGHTATVDALIQGRADVNAVNKYGGTPLDLAKVSGKTEVARLLEAAGGRRG